MTDWKSMLLDDPEDWPQEVIVQLEGAHEDERGYIQPLCDLPMKSASLIFSKKGTVRANHFHHTDWHYCYVVSGRIEYSHRTAGSDEPPEVVEIKQGGMFFTPPKVEHAMVFPEDTLFLTLSRNPRDQASYEADVERIELVQAPKSE